jgi:glyoxylase-like metal-dependent hydrolase (beta-lactamase superfamily II)
VIQVVEHGPVSEVVMSTAFSRAAGFRVSAFYHRGLVIDTGFPRMAATFFAWLATVPATGFVVTHFHEDHAGNLGLVTARGIPATVSAVTLRRHRDLARVPPYRWMVWGHPHVSVRDPEPAEHPFQLIPTPGHTADHVAVYDPDARIVFSGDLFLGVKAALAHVDESPSAMVASLREIAALRPRAVFDSHRGSLRDPVTMLTSKADWLEATMGSIRTADRAGQPPSVIVRELLGGEDRAAVVSFGQVSKRNFVQAVLAGQ